MSLGKTKEASGCFPLLELKVSTTQHIQVPSFNWNATMVGKAIGCLDAGRSRKRGEKEWGREYTYPEIVPFDDGSPEDEETV